MAQYSLEIKARKTIYYHVIILMCYISIGFVELHFSKVPLVRFWTDKKELDPITVGQVFKNLRK